MRSILSLAIITLLTAGCGGEAPDAAGPAGGSSAVSVPGDAGRAIDELQATLDQHAARGPAAAEGPSFAPYAGRLDELLTLEMAAEATGLEPSEAEKKYAKGSHSLVYRWPSNRTKEVMGMRLAAFNLVGAAYLREGVTEDFFRSRFVQASDEQVRQVQAEAGREGAARGLDEASTNLARELAATLSKVHPIEEIEGVGDVAIWEQRDHDASLHLLVNGTSLELTVSVGDDPAVNRDATVALARRLLERL